MSDKPTRTEDNVPTCGFGTCVQPVVAAVSVQVVENLVNSNKGIDNRRSGALLLCAEHWSRPPDKW